TADSPGQPSVDDVGKNYVELSWPRPIKDGGARITGYVVEKRKRGAPDWEPTTPDGKPVSGNQARVDGLDENGEYEFRVRPVNAAGVGAPSDSTPMIKIRPKRDKPNGPEEVKVAELFADNCKLEWTPPENDGGSPITGYIVEKCDAATGVWERVPTSPSGTSCPVRGLVEGKRYRFRVSAVNALGPSEPTEAVGAYTAKNPFDSPDSPDNLAIDNFDKHSVDLSWVPPKYDGGNPVKGYLIEKRTPKGEWKPATAGLVTGSSAHLSGLEPGQTYEFRVSAVNDAGPGRPSRATAPHVMKDPSFPAGAPDGLNVDKVNKNGVKLSWQKPRKDGGSKITGYQVEKKDDQGNWVPVKQTTEPCAFIPMKEGETNQFRVRAINDEGPGEPTKPTAPLTAADQPEAPRIVTPEDCVGGPGTGVVAWFGHPSPTFSWTLDDKPIRLDGSRVTTTNVPLPPPAHPGPGGSLELPAGGVTVLQVGKVTRADRGRYQLTVMNDLGQTTTSCQVEVLDAPGVPGGPLEPVDVKADEITLSWKAPADDGGQPSPTATVRNLEEGKEYEFRVMAENENGVGQPLVTEHAVKARHPFDPPSGMSTPKVDTTTDDSVSLSWEPPRKGPITGYVVEKRAKGERNWTKYVQYSPDSPDNLAIDNFDKHSVDLSWVPPKYDGGNPVKGYLIEKRTPKGEWKPATAGLVTGSSAHLSGLEPGQTYEFRVSAVNDAGPGRPSRATAPHVMKDPSSIRLFCRHRANVHPITGNEYTVKGLPQGKEFEFRVVPVNAAGPGEPSEPTPLTKVQKPKIPAGAPDGLNVDKVNKNGVKLSWQKPRKDGGSKITGYQVEKKDDQGNWVPVKQTTEPCAFIPMKEGETNQFRVRAINDEGPGEPTKPTAPLTAADQPEAPRIVTPEDCVGGPGTGVGGLKDVTLKAGQELKLPVAWFGHPSPTFSWTLDDKPIRLDGSRVTTTNGPLPSPAHPGPGGSLELPAGGVTVLQVGKVTRADRGRYQLTVMNDLGQTTTSCQVEVLGICSWCPWRSSGASAPKIGRDAPREINATNGEPFKIRIPYSGSPPDDIEVTKDGIPVDLNSGRFQLTITPDEVVITDTKAEKTDEGDYKIKLKNEKGEDTLPLKIKILGPPASPQGPLEVSNIKADSCTLSWRPPTDTGGSPITHYVVEKQDLNTGDWTPVSKFVRTPEYDVLGLEEGKKHKFRVRAANEFGLGEPLELERPFTAENPSTPAGSPGSVNVDGVGKNFVDLSWDRPTKDGGARLLGYQVEMRKKDSPDWIPVPQTPDGQPVPGTYLHVDGLNEGDDYQFRVRAINAAGPGEPSNPTSMVKVMDRKGTETPDFITKLRPTTAPLGGSAVFEVQVDGQPQPEVKWFRDGLEFVPSARVRIHPPGPDGKAMLELSNLDERDSGNITCQVSNPSGKNACSSPLEVFGVPKVLSGVDDKVASEGDLIKIKVPYSGRGTISLKLKQNGREVPESARVKLMDLDGMATVQLKAPPSECQGPLVASDTTPFSTRLSWKPPKSDGGAKVNHYVLEKMEVGRDRWVPVSSGCRDTTCEVQGLQENGKYLFRVAAVNDCDKPGKPGELTATEVGSDFVNLSWARPSSDGGGRIRGYLIEKRDIGAPNWSRVTQHPVLTTSFNVPNLIEDITYEFRVIAVNDAGESEPSVIDRPVLVKDPKAVSRPTLVGSLRPQTVNEGRDAEFEIEVDCPSAYEVIWSKGPPKPRINLTSRWQEPTEWDRGDTIRIKVPFTGYPKPTAKWSLNGKELREGKQVKMELKDRHAILTLENVGEEFSGKLTIQLENDMGSDSATIELRINDRPPPPINLKVEGVSDGSALLSWAMPSNTGYVSQYIIERRELPGDAWIRAGTNRFSTYNCEGLRNGKEYEFRVIAENLHGRSDPSQPTSAQLIQPDSRQRGDRRDRGQGRDHNIWDHKVPLPTQVHKGESVYDYYDILEELGRLNLLLAMDSVKLHMDIAVIVCVCRQFLKRRFKFDIIQMDFGQVLIRDQIHIFIGCVYTPGLVKQLLTGATELFPTGPEDIMCETSRSTNIKLVDFGLSRKLNPDESVRVTTATPEFAAPEIARYEPVGFYTDMWAIGVLSYVLVTFGSVALLSVTWPIIPLSARTCETSTKYTKPNFDRKEAGPRFVKWPHNLLVGEGENAQFDCRVLALSEPIVTCRVRRFLSAQTGERRLRSSSQQPSSYEYKSMLSDTTRSRRGQGSLTRLTERHTSETRELRDGWDTKTETRTMKIISERRDSNISYDLPPSPTIPAPKLQQPLVAPSGLREGESLVLNVEFSGSKSSVNAIRWFQNGKELKPDRNCKIETSTDGRTSKLTISNVSQEHSGLYEVQSVNKTGSANSQTQVFIEPKPVSVDTLNGLVEEEEQTQTQPVNHFHEIPVSTVDRVPDERSATIDAMDMKVMHQTPPVFVTHPVGQLLEEGAELVLECRVSGTPTPDIRWLRNGTSIQSAHSMSQENDYSRLELPSVVLEDAGSYECCARNAAGEARSVAHVLVKATEQDLPGPEFVSVPQSATVVEGTSIILECSFNPGTVKTVEWERNGQPIDRTLIEFDESSDSSICRLIDITQRKGTGTYSILATAPDGTKSTWSFALQVKAATQPEDLDAEFS
ncbi:hypothetical protein AHF37_04474, partial [Paragonimus kellicotti]